MATHAAEWMMVRNAACGLARWNGQVSQAQLTTLCREYGVAWPVRIKRSAGTKTHGTHRTEPYYIDSEKRIAYRHVITMSTYLSVLDANVTLKHELCHSRQVEDAVKEGKTPREHYREYQAQGNSGKAYRRNRYEVEAREAGADERTPITQTHTISEREQQAVLARMCPAWHTFLKRHIAREALEGGSPAIGKHFAALVLNNIPAEARNIGTVIHETGMSDNKTNERREAEAKLLAWRAERGLRELEPGELRSMVDKHLAKQHADHSA